MQVGQTTNLIAATPCAKAAARTAAPSGAVADPKLLDACKQFEGQFFGLVLQEMQKTVPDDPELGDDAHEQQIFQGMFDDNMAQQMAKQSSGPNDLAAQMYRQLLVSDPGAGAAPGGAQSALAQAEMAVAGIKTGTEATENEHE